ncbi:MAG: hypothetical protein JW774_01965 [Candidatus Aureabacteria bacterium]|nr:hypothetical protein [Candidatus Auribacterota bacterium]
MNRTKIEQFDKNNKKYLKFIINDRLEPSDAVNPSDDGKTFSLKITTAGSF